LGFHPEGFLVGKCAFCSARTFRSILMRLPEPSGRQSGDLGEKWPLWILLTDTTGSSPPKELVLRIFITLKNPSTSVGIEPANLGSSGKHANH
jgi:hypothetical protein